MRIGILGTGIVGNALGTKLVQLGHEVRMGSRMINNPKAVEWANKAGAGASQGTFSDAAAFGEVLFNCTSGFNSIRALRLAGIPNLKGKVLVDVANALDFSTSVPSLSIANTDSLGEQIQRAFPEARVVKTLNTMSAALMVDPSLVPGEHDVLMSGNNPEAKAQVRAILESFGWRNIIDLGDISTSRGAEMWFALWIRLMLKYKSPMFNLHIQKPEA